MILWRKTTILLEVLMGQLVLGLQQPHEMTRHVELELPMTLTWVVSVYYNSLTILVFN